jgi:hypothetical protein
MNFTKHSNFFSKAFVFGVWCLGTISLNAQENQGQRKVQILQADNILRDQSQPDVQRLIGDVVLGYRDARLYCDSAWRYSDGQFRTMGEVRLIDGSQRLQANELNLNPETQRVRAKSIGDSPVVLDADAGRLETELLDYSLNSKIATLPNGGQLEEGERSIRFNRGRYLTALQVLQLGGDVQLTSADYDLQSDSVHWDERQRVFSFHAPSHLASRNGQFELWCEFGEFDETTESGWFADSLHVARVRDQSIWLQANYLELPADSAEPSLATGHVWIRDTLEHWELHGANAKRWDSNPQKGATLWVTGDSAGRVHWIDFGEADSLFLVSDTLQVDEKFLHAWPDVLMRQGEESHARAADLHWDRDSGLVKLQGKPAMWLEDWMLQSDSLEWEMLNNRPSSLLAWGHVGLSKPVTELCFQQIVGRQITGDFTEGELKKLMVNGNAESVYFNEDVEDPCAEFNQSQSSRMRIDFEDNAVQQIVLLEGPEGTWMSNGLSVPAFEDANWEQAPLVTPPRKPFTQK